MIFNDSNGQKKIFHLYKNNTNKLENKLGIIKYKGTAHLRFLRTKWGNLYNQICYDVYTTIKEGGFDNIDILLVPSFNLSEEFINSIKRKSDELKLVAGYANTINEGRLRSNIFVPPKEGRGAILHGLKSFHKDKWDEGKINLETPIFDFEPEKDKLKKVEINGINFWTQNLIFDIIQLDARKDKEFFN